MSNDISPSRVPPTATALPTSLNTKGEVVARQASADIPKPVAPAVPDPKEARRALQEATELLNQQMQRNNRDLSFSVDDVANRVVVVVKNRAGEVVRQIPNEVALRVAHNLENVKGLLKDDKS